MAFFGRETRYVARIYALRILIVAVAAMSIVLSLDLAINLEAVMAGDTVVPGTRPAAHIAYYLFLRAGYNLPALLPIAAAIGVVWAEFGLARGNERIMILNSGRAPLLSLIPAAVVGLMLGLAQLVSLSHIRPMTVEAQAMAGFRDYGPRYVGGASATPRWIMAEGALLYGRVNYAEPVALIDVTAYVLDAQGRVAEILASRAARPTEQGGLWEFSAGTRWRADRPTAEPAAEFDRLALQLRLDPLWLSYSEVPVRFLPQPVLRALAVDRPEVPQGHRFRASHHERLAGPMHAMAMTLLAATLSLKLLATKVSLSAALRIGLVGYGVHVAIKIMAMLGEYGHVPAVAGGWLIPSAVVVGCVSLLWAQERRVRRALAPARGRHVARPDVRRQSPEN